MVTLVNKKTGRELCIVLFREDTLYYTAFINGTWHCFSKHDWYKTH